MTTLQTELYELFGDKVYFKNDKNDKRDDGITDRFLEKENSHIVGYINCEDDGTEDIIDYEECYGGNFEFNKILTKYNLNFEWEDTFIVSLFNCEGGTEFMIQIPNNS